MPYANAVPVKNASADTLAPAPAVVIHLPRRSETTAVRMAAQMKTSLKAWSATVPEPSGKTKPSHACAATKTSEPPSQTGLVTQ